MPDLSKLIESGTGNAWLLLPTAVLLGALHALEPGHSKSMMTAFIVAVHGTARQASLLAISATVGHTIVVWVLALVAWRFGDNGFLENAEPWLLLIGGMLIVALALRILLRLESPFSFDDSGSGPNSGSDHGHSHTHGDHDHPHDHEHENEFENEDAHAAAHSAEIKKRFSGGPVTNAEVAWFGFSGGLLPCPAAFAVLLACLHQKAYALGLVMVAAFSVGLAATLVAVGVAAAWGANAIKSRVSGFEKVARWAPYVSAAIILIIGGTVAGQGIRAFGYFVGH